MKSDALFTWMVNSLEYMTLPSIHLLTRKEFNMKRLADPAIVSSRLKALRKEKGLTQIAVSSLTGISLPAIKQYETGARIPDSVNIYILSNFYKVDVRYILGKI